MTKKRASANDTVASETKINEILIELHFEATQIDDLLYAASLAFEAYPSKAPVSAVLNAAREKMATLCTVLDGIRTP